MIFERYFKQIQDYVDFSEDGYSHYFENFRMYQVQFVLEFCKKNKTVFEICFSKQSHFLCLIFNYLGFKTTNGMIISSSETPPC